MNAHQPQPTAAAHDADGPFDVQLGVGGRVLTVAPDQSVAEALLAVGIEITLSCAQGVCGTCVTPVLEGVPDHRDLYLTDAEHASNKLFTPCCSRAQTPCLVIALTLAAGA